MDALREPRFVEAPLMHPRTPAQHRDEPPPEREAQWLSAGFPRSWPSARYLRWRLPEFAGPDGLRFFEATHKLFGDVRDGRILWLYKSQYSYGRTESSRGDRKDEGEPSAGATLSLFPLVYQQNARGRVELAGRGPTWRVRVDEAWIPANQPVGALRVRFL